MEVQSPEISRNQLIVRLSSMERAYFEPSLCVVELPLRFSMELPGRPFTHVYFPLSGLASIVSPNPRRVPTEIGIVGREGMTGLSILHGTDRSPFHTFVQIAGRFGRIPVEDFAELVRGDGMLRGMLAYSRAFLIQVSETAKANASANIEQRLARWLLMSSDRIDSEVVPLTHDFLAGMMSVRRAGVTEAVHALARKAILSTHRARLTIVNRKALEDVAGHFYGIAEKEALRLSML